MISQQFETILIIEPDLKKYKRINKILKPHFSILYSKDGLEGLKMAKFYEPSLILCSEEIKKISCFLFTSLIQESKITAHIPVILVTTEYSSIISTLSFREGIDGLINYKTNPKEIIAQIKNRINNRVRLSQLYEKKWTSSENYSIENQSDKIILERVDRIVNANLTNAANINVDVNFICNTLGMSRSVLQSKIKRITNESLGTYIRALKLKKAKNLLTGSDEPINHISEISGFNSRQAFIKAFKRKFNTTPSAFRKTSSVLAV